MPVTLFFFFFFLPPLPPLALRFFRPRPSTPESPAGRSLLVGRRAVQLHEKRLQLQHVLLAVGLRRREARLLQDELVVLELVLQVGVAHLEAAALHQLGEARGDLQPLDPHQLRRRRRALRSLRRQLGVAFGTLASTGSDALRLERLLARAERLGAAHGEELRLLRLALARKPRRLVVGAREHQAAARLGALHPATIVDVAPYGVQPLDARARRLFPTKASHAQNRPVTTTTPVSGRATGCWAVKPVGFY